MACTYSQTKTRIMRIVSKQKPAKKREEYRQRALEIRGRDKCAFFEQKADMEDFRAVVRGMGLKVKTRKDGGWFAWVE